MNFQSMTIRRRVVTMFVVFSIATPGAVVYAATKRPVAAAAKYSACPPFRPGVINDAPSIPSGQKTVALTFDDGPGHDTVEIMNILKAAGIRATFFNNASDRYNVTSEVLRNGFLLGSHTASHHFMRGAPRAVQASELDRQIAWQFSHTATTPCVFRPPYGAFDDTTVELVNARNQSFFTWNASGGDWQARGSGSQKWIDYIASSAVNLALRHHNSDILLHDQPIHMPATVAALPIIIQRLKTSGYSFVDMLGRTGPPASCGPDAVPTPSVAGLRIDDGTTIASGDVRRSPNGQFELSMGSNGNLVWRLSGGRVLWSSQTAGHPGAIATVTGGVLQVVDGGTTLWQSTAVIGSSTGLTLSNNGLLTTATWNSNSLYSQIRRGDTLRPGAIVMSPDQRCRLTVGAQGNLTLTDATGQTLFDNGVRLGVRSQTKLQADGQLVSTAASGVVGFSTWTSGRVNDYVEITNSGRIAVVGAGGFTVWSTQ
jgi:peptidoglycan/xylan/chitin deacetylase (PgdA/CDA1 family)